PDEVSQAESAELLGRKKDEARRGAPGGAAGIEVRGARPMTDRGSDGHNGGPAASGAEGHGSAAPVESGPPAAPRAGARVTIGSIEGGQPSHGGTSNSSGDRAGPERRERPRLGPRDPRRRLRTADTERRRRNRAAWEWLLEKFLFLNGAAAVVL